MGSSPSKVGGDDDDGWGLFEACNCASDADCMTTSDRRMGTPKAYAFSSPPSSAQMRSSGSQQPNSDSKVVGMAMSPRFLQESPRNKSMSRLLRYNESPRATGYAALGPEGEAPSSRDNVGVAISRRT
eukprot:2688254-Rhodomonas_salina.1